MSTTIPISSFSPATFACSTSVLTTYTNNVAFSSVNLITTTETLSQISFTAAPSFSTLPLSSSFLTKPSLLQTSQLTSSPLVPLFHSTTISPSVSGLQTFIANNENTQQCNNSSHIVSNQNVDLAIVLSQAPSTLQTSFLPSFVSSSPSCSSTVLPQDALNLTINFQQKPQQPKTTQKRKRCGTKLTQKADESHNDIPNTSNSSFSLSPSSSSSSPSSSKTNVIIKDESTLAANDDEDDENDDEKLLSTHCDQERLKAFNMFVKLFVDENLDRVAPISKQPKEKVQAIIEACDRQFPEFIERSRKRIRTYLKSCRRIKKSKLEDSKQKLTYLTSSAAESILAQACENESNNAKRMRMGLEPLTAEQAQASYLLGLNILSDNQSVIKKTSQAPNNHFTTPPPAHAAENVSKENSFLSLVGYNASFSDQSKQTEKDIENQSKIMKNKPKLKTEADFKSYSYTITTNVNQPRPLTAHQPITSYFCVNQFKNVSSDMFFHRQQYNTNSQEVKVYGAKTCVSYSSNFPITSSKPQPHTSMTLPLDPCINHDFAHHRFNSSEQSFTETPTDLSLRPAHNNNNNSINNFKINNFYCKNNEQFGHHSGLMHNQSYLNNHDSNMKKVNNVSTTSSINNGHVTIFNQPFRIYLSAEEVATIKQLIIGYKESASFLHRSAEELQQLINNNNNIINNNNQNSNIINISINSDVSKNVYNDKTANT